MSDKIRYQEGIISKLTTRMQKQKELLMVAKEKVSQVEELELRIRELEQENQTLRSGGKRGLSPLMDHRPLTIDLTGNSLEKESPRSSGITDSFLSQVKKSSSQKTAHKQLRPSTTSNMDFGNNKIAESTSIMNNPPIRSVPIGSKLQTSSFDYDRGQAPNSHSSANYSNGSSNTSFTSGAFISPNLRSNPSAIGHESRAAKSRASTSQVAQRLSAHMKIGSLQRPSQSSSSRINYNSLRPGSSFTQHVFKRR